MQIPVLKDVLDQMNIPRYEKEGYEADDLIGAISRRCEAEGWECVIVTGDKDSLQLITDQTRVKLVTTSMGASTSRDMTRAVFVEEYGFEPIHMIDLKALMGDASDRLPGVPGIGEKTALSLVRMYGSIDRLYDAMPDIVIAPETPAKPGMVKKLAAGEESARESYYLATIVTDVPDFSFTPGDNLRQEPKQGLYDLFLRLEFTKLIEKFGLAPVQKKMRGTSGHCGCSGTGADCGSGRAPAGSVARCGSRFAACAAGPDRRSSVLCAVGGCCRSDRIVF